MPLSHPRMASTMARRPPEENHSASRDCHGRSSTATAGTGTKAQAHSRLARTARAPGAHQDAGQAGWLPAGRVPQRRRPGLPPAARSCCATRRSPPSPRAFSLPPPRAPRSSKGRSSPSSESSWYDPPLGPGRAGSARPGTLLAAPDAREFRPPIGFPTRDAPKLFSQSAPLILRDPYPNASLGSLAPAALRLSDDYMGTRASLSARVSFAFSDMDAEARGARGAFGQLASFTPPLPQVQGSWARSPPRRTP